jgi:hypothetical protein
MEITVQNVGDYPCSTRKKGGDGGMEYAMCTFDLGQGTFEGLLGVTAPMAHSWFQHSFKRIKHGDEGFTSFRFWTGRDSR